MDIEEIRRQLHLRDEVIALNSGSWGPLCQAARDAINEGYKHESSSRGDDPEGMREKGSGLARYSEVVSSAKDVLSRFLSCSPAEVALCDSTTTGMNIFMWGYDWKPGDEIIAGNLENPAAKVPLMVLAKRHGVKLTYITQNGDTIGELENSINDNTRMVLLSDVNFADGARIDLAEASKMTRSHDALLLADGIQAVGTSHVDMKQLGVDGYAMARHKFMCGPDGAGALYISKNAMDYIHPTYSGVFSDALHGSGELTYPDSAQRYEVSTRPLPVIQGGTAATEWIMDEITVPFIVKRTTELYKSLWEGLSDITKVDMVSQSNQNSLLSFRVDGYDSKEVVDEFRKQYIFTRTIGALDPPTVRVAVGFWNRESDMEKIVEVVKKSSCHRKG